MVFDLKLPQPPFPAVPGQQPHHQQLMLKPDLPLLPYRNQEIPSHRTVHLVQTKLAL